MSYNEQNQPGKGRGKKNYGFSDQTTGSGLSGSQGLGESSTSKEETEPWKQKLQEVSLEGDEQKDKKDESRNDFTSQKSSEKSSDYGSSYKKDRKGEEAKSDEDMSSEKKEEEGSDEEGENGEPGRRGEGRGNNFSKQAKKALEFIEKRTENMDKGTIAKYAAVGILLFVGLRKSGFLGGLLATTAAGILTKALAEEAFELVEESEEEEGEETETATA